MAQTSSFSSNQAGKHVATLTLQHGDGSEQQYTPFGEDARVQLDGDAVVFELSGNPTYLEISEVVGDHKPCYIHVAGTGIDYMVPYVGQNAEDGFRFAIPDTQTRALRWWLCRQGAPWDSGITYPLADTIKTVTPAYAQAKSVFDAGHTQCIKYNGIIYMLANVTASEATYISRDNITLKTLTVDTNNNITVNSYKVAQDLGWLGVHGPSTYAGEKYVKVCELEAYSFRAVYNTRFQISIAPSKNGGTDGESAIFNLSIHCDNVSPSFDEGIKASWECLEKQSLASSKIAQCVVVFNTNGKIEVWLEFVNASGIEAYITVLANNGNSAGTHSDSPWAGPLFAYPCDYVTSSSTGWDAGATAIYTYPAHEMTTAMIVRLDDLDSATAESMIAAQTNGKPIIVVKSTASKDTSYFITSRNLSGTTKYFYGVAFDPATSDLEVLNLEYDSSGSTWTHSILTDVIGRIISDKVVVVNSVMIANLPASRRADFCAMMATAANDYYTVVEYTRPNSSDTIDHYRFVEYTVTGNTTSFVFSRTYPVYPNTMEMQVVYIAYNSTSNTFTTTTETKSWAVTPV